MPQGICQSLLAELMPSRWRGLLLNAAHPFWQAGGILLATSAQWVTSSSNATGVAANASIVAAANATVETDELRLFGVTTSFATLAMLSAAPSVAIAILIFVAVEESPLWLHHARGQRAGFAAAARLAARQDWPRRPRAALASRDSAATSKAVSSSSDAASSGGKPSVDAALRSAREQQCARLYSRRGASIGMLWFLLCFAFNSTDFFLIRYLHRWPKPH